MPDLIASTGPAPTMSSREIAELTGKQHQHVKRDIETMLAELEEDASSFGRIYFDSMNRQQNEFLLDRELTETLLTGYSAVLRRKVIARWRELEAAKPRELSRLEVLEIALETERRNIALTAEIAAAKPAIEFVASYVDSTSGAKGFRDVCKLLGAKENKFRQFLFDKKIMYRLGKELMPYANQLDTGRFEVHAGVTEETGHAYNRAKFTAKGINWVAGEWAKFNLKASEA